MTKGLLATKISPRRRVAAFVGWATFVALAGSSVTRADSLGTHNHRSEAKTCYVDKIKYTNHGGYSVSWIDLYYVKPNTQKYEYSGSYYPALNKEVDIDQSNTVDLGRFDGKTSDWNSWPTLKDGDEIWIKIAIALGESESCHKDMHRLVYRKDVGVTMKFKSSGTTLNNNRCKYDGNMDDDCFTGE